MRVDFPESTFKPILALNVGQRAVHIVRLSKYQCGRLKSLGDRWGKKCGTWDRLTLVFGGAVSENRDSPMPIDA